MHTYSFMQPAGDKLCIIRHPPLPGCVRGARTLHGNGAGPWLAAQCYENTSNSDSHCISRISIMWDSAFCPDLIPHQARKVKFTTSKTKSRAASPSAEAGWKWKSRVGLEHPIFLACMQRETSRGFENHIPWEQAGEENSWQESRKVKPQAPFCRTWSGSRAPVLDKN